MKRTTFSFVLVLLSFASFAQTQLPDVVIYRGNPFTISLIVASADSALPTTAVLYANQMVRTPMAGNNQPTVTRAGRQAFITWVNTSNLPDTRAWLEISVGSLIKWTCWVMTNKRPAVVLDPKETISGPVPYPGSTSKIYPLSNVLGSGYVIEHNKGNRLVTATFYRQDTDQVDPLWRIKVLSANSVEVVGPPGEVFTGKAVLNFTFLLSN